MVGGQCLPCRTDVVSVCNIVTFLMWPPVGLCFSYLNWAFRYRCWIEHCYCGVWTESFRCAPSVISQSKQKHIHIASYVSSESGRVTLCRDDIKDVLRDQVFIDYGRACFPFFCQKSTPSPSTLCHKFITSTNIYRFAVFFHRHTLPEISNKMAIKDLIISQTCRYTLYGN